MAIGGPVDLRLLSNTVVTGGHQGAVHDQHGVLAEPFARLERQRWAEVTDDAIGRELRDTEQWCELSQSQVGAPVCGDQQDPVLQWQAPRPAFPDRVRTLAPQRSDQLAELPRAQLSRNTAWLPHCVSRW